MEIIKDARIQCTQMVSFEGMNLFNEVSTDEAMLVVREELEFGTILEESTGIPKEQPKCKC